MNPYYIERMLNERRREMMAEAERLRLVAAYNAHSSRRRGYFLLTLGNILIRFGEYLKRRYSQVESLETQTCRK